MDRDEAADPCALPSDVPMPAPGDVIEGKYRIEDVVGRGGMSVVYRATHVPLDQQVAIKVLSAAALVMPSFVARLKREARAASRIRSEHVVRVYDIGELPGRRVPYLVMEHLSGLDLSQVLSRRGPFPPSLAIECILQSCEALAEAHAAGIVHRDLKPANLFLTEGVDGSQLVKVLDFGISRMASRRGLSTLTDPGTVLGTPSYMAPEQMEGVDDIDGRSDIWALGAILFELLAGTPPYTGETLPQIFMKIMRERAPRIRQRRRDVPGALEDVILRCLAVDPARRYASVADLAWALSELGAPHARDSAERISRVQGRCRKERAADAVPSEPAVMVRSTAHERAYAYAGPSRLAAASASGLVLAVAMGLGAFGAHVLTRSRAVASQAPPSEPSCEGSAPAAPAEPPYARVVTPEDGGAAAVQPAEATASLGRSKKARARTCSERSRPSGP